MQPNAAAVKPASGLPEYIERGKRHMREKLTQAIQQGKTPEGMMNLGDALDVVQDYYAHSNLSRWRSRKSPQERAIRAVVVHAKWWRRRRHTCRLDFFDEVSGADPTRCLRELDSLNEHLVIGGWDGRTWIERQHSGTSTRRP